MIDLHTHVVPDVLTDLVGTGDARWPILEVDPDGERANVYIGGDLFRRVARASWNLQRRLDDLNMINVTGHLVSPMPELFSYWAPPSQAAEYCRRVNQWLGAWCREGGEGVEGLGVLPLQDPDRSLEVLREVRAAGLVGVEIGTHVADVAIGDQRFWPIFEEAARSRLLIFVHAFHPRCLDCLSGQRQAAVGLPIEVSLAMGSLFGNDVLGRFPDLRILSSHGGGGVLASISRLQYHYEVDETVRAGLSISPWEAARKVYYDSMTFDADSLRYLVDRIGADKVVVGSDYPFAPRVAGWNLEAAGLTREQQLLIETTNAQVLWRAVAS